MDTTSASRFLCVFLLIFINALSTTFDSVAETPSTNSDLAAPADLPNPLAGTPVEKSDGDGRPPASYQITFNGLDVAGDWARTARTLLDKGVIVTEPAAAKQSESLCAVAKRALGFNLGHIKLSCTHEMEQLLLDLNPDFQVRHHVDDFVSLPGLYLEPIVQTYTYDLSHAPDSARYKSDVFGRRSQYILQQPPVHANIATVSYQAFVSIVQAQSTPDNLLALRSIVTFDSSVQRFRISVLKLESLPNPQHFANDPLNDWWTGCAQGGPPSPRPTYATYVGLYTQPACQNLCLQQNTCPDVTIYDRPVAPHPLLLAAQRKMAPGSVAVSTDCPVLKPWSDEFHGTHMAGIIASRSTGGQEGLAPNVKLLSIDDRTGGLPELENSLEDEARGIGTNIFLVAQQFKDTGELAPLYINPDSDEVIAKSTFAGQVQDKERVLWIIAAGEPNANGTGTGMDVQPTGAFYPMNLGSFRNVIVVTTCEDCFGPSPHIAPWANYSTSRLVSLAAPGGTQQSPVISTADQDGYSRAFGTSQSAAFVAGIAAEMRSCNSAISAAQIKERLVVTADPILDGTLGHKINSGIVNAARAVNLDGGQSWVTLKGAAMAQTLTDMAWCRNNIEIRHLGSGTAEDDAAIPVRGVARLKAVLYPGSGEPGFMVAYNGKQDRLNGILWTYMPMAVDPGKSGQALFSGIINGNPVRQYVRGSDLDDLVLSTKRVSAVREDGDCLASQPSK